MKDAELLVIALDEHNLPFLLILTASICNYVLKSAPAGGIQKD